MNETLATSSKTKPEIGPEGRRRPTVRSRGKRRPHSFDGSRMDPTKRLSSRIAIFPTASLSTSKQVTSTGPIWAPALPQTTAPSSALISTARIVGSSSQRASLLRRSRFISIKQASKLYWCDREGMRVMRANLDGSLVETLIETGRGDADRRDQTRWCVGVTIDPERKQIYWTQKGPDNGERGRLLRAGVEIPKGETAADRSDIEVFFDRSAGAD